MILKELPAKFISSRNGKPPWFTKALVRTVHMMKHHDVVGSGIAVNKFHDKRTHECTKQELIPLEEATEAYMVEDTAETHTLMLQRTSCRFSTCLQQWQGKEVEYSSNILTCALS